nr:amino acid racemase [Corynebacterium mendelii]
MIGGMTWATTEGYYRIINECVQQRLGGLHSARIVVSSLDFAELEQQQRLGDWNRVADIVCAAAADLERAQVDMVLICSNTMHKVADAVAQRICPPLLHVAEATARSVRAAGIDTVGLLGTRYTMCQDFYTGILESHGIRVVLPNSSDIGAVNSVIVNELYDGTASPTSREDFLRIISGLGDKGAQAVVTASAQVALLMDVSGSRLPVFDTARIHAEAAVDLALSGMEQTGGQPGTHRMRLRRTTP